MLTALMTMLILAAQVQLPTAPASTWDGVPGSEVVQTDAETGEVTYPMGEQPVDALAMGCVFGRSNVRCPATPKDPRPSTALTFEDLGITLSVDGRPIGALDHEAGNEGSPAEATAGRLSFEDGVRRARAQDPSPERRTAPAPQSNCRREETRDPDTGSFNARLVCGSDGAASEELQRLRDSTRPSSGY